MVIEHTPLEEVFIFFDTATYDQIERDVKVNTTSAQRVPEHDPLPGISVDTRPDPIQFWKSSGSG